MKNYHLIFIVLCFLLSSCVQPLKYVGEKSAPTTSVAVVTSASDIKKSYKVVGHLTIHKYSPAIMRKYLEKHAKQVGADAIILPSDSTLKSMSGPVTVEVLKYQ
ncbi:MAG: hypothetical protein ACXVB0_17220 [Mucilaginibacter sp.]